MGGCDVIFEVILGGLEVILGGHFGRSFWEVMRSFLGVIVGGRDVILGGLDVILGGHFERS